MNQQNDELIFADETPRQTSEIKGIWKVLVVDDEPQVHTVTKLVLRDLTFKGKSIKFYDAYSASEAKKVLADNPDICLALVDVVMEEDDAGLRLVEYIRKIMNNKSIRIILRTGQPGYAPEKEVIIDYDINDYKEKTEMSAQKLITCIITAFRNYEYIAELNTINAELEEKIQERVKELKAALDTLQEDQNTGRKMQNKILPEPSKTIGDYSFSSKLFPSLTLSGDFVDYFEIGQRYIGLYIADVSGHGVSSAIVTVLLKNFIDNRIEKYTLKGDETVLDPLEICRRLNNNLIRENLGKYMTIFYGIIDMETNTLRYSNCGQFPSPALCTDGECGFLPEKGTPVGLFKLPVFRTAEVKLPEHFTMLFASDGLLDVLPEKGVDEKIARILKALPENGDNLDKVIRGFGIEELENLPDDITFMLITK